MERKGGGSYYHWGWRKEDVLHKGKVKGKNDDDNCACRGGGSHSAAMQQESG